LKQILNLKEIFSNDYYLNPDCLINHISLIELKSDFCSYNLTENDIKYKMYIILLPLL